MPLSIDSLSLFFRYALSLTAWKRFHGTTIRAMFRPWQYVRRIAFMSTSATTHQNFRFEFDTVKNSRADSPARTDPPPARAGFSKSRTADRITAAPRRR